MKVLVPALAALLLAGCHSSVVTHRKDFSPAKAQGPWTDHLRAVERGETPEPPKEKK